MGLPQLNPTHLTENLTESGGPESRFRNEAGGEFPARSVSSRFRSPGQVTGPIPGLGQVVSHVSAERTCRKKAASRSQSRDVRAHWGETHRPQEGNSPPQAADLAGTHRPPGACAGRVHRTRRFCHPALNVDCARARVRLRSTAPSTPASFCAQLHSAAVRVTMRNGTSWLARCGTCAVLGFSSVERRLRHGLLVDSCECGLDLAVAALPCADEPVRTPSGQHSRCARGFPDSLMEGAGRGRPAGRAGALHGPRPCRQNGP